METACMDGATFFVLQSLKSDDLRERLEESEKLMNEMEKTWEDKLKETERIHMVLLLLDCNQSCVIC
jgi:hypothetical protein